jgi:hypothetical protein
MEPMRVALWCVMSGGADLLPDLKSKAKDPDWWQHLEDTPEDKLEPDQLRMLSALGANLSSLPPDERD